MSVSIATLASGNARTGWNYAETVQTPAKLRAQGLKLARRFQMWGDGRGSEGQPVIAAGRKMRDGLTHDVMVVNTMAGDVWAFDHATLRVLWVQHLCNAVPGTLKMDMWRVNDNWSLLPTPVLDLDRGISWHVGMTSPDGSFEKSTWMLHGLNLLDGSAVCAPIDLAGASYQPPGGLANNIFGSVKRKVRPGLLLDYNRNGVSTLYVCAGSFNENAATNRGWLIAVDVTHAAQAQIACAITTTARYSGGGNWMSGNAPAMDSDGNVFVVVGNGAFDRVTEFGESLVKYRYTPKTATAAAKLAPEGTCTRFTDTGNVAGSKYQTLADTSLLPAAELDAGDNRGGTSNMDSPDDMDECSGVTLMEKGVTGFSTDIVFYSGKGGIGILANAENMPNMALADFAPDRIQAHVYGKMLAITGFTDGFGFGTPQAMNITPTDLSLLQTTFGGLTHHLHALALHYQSPTEGCLLIGGGENGPVRVFRITEPTPGTFQMAYVATGTALASPGMPSPGGMPGWMCNGWSDGSKPGTGAFAAFAPYGNANQKICPGRLVIYAADNFVNGELEVLWDSEQWACAFTFNKFGKGIMCSGVLDYCDYAGGVLQFA